MADLRINSCNQIFLRKVIVAKKLIDTLATSAFVIDNDGFWRMCCTDKKTDLVYKVQAQKSVSKP